MRIRAQGILDYLDYVDRKELEEKKRQDAKEATVLNLIGKYGVGGETLASLSGTKSGKNKVSSSSVGSLSKYLMNTYNISKDVLSPIIASGDKTALPRLQKYLDEMRKNFESAGKTMPNELVNEVLETAVIEMPTTKPINYDMYEEYIGRELDPLYKNIIGNEISTPGSVVYKESAYVSDPGLEDLERFEKRAVTNNYSRAQIELSSITKAQNKLLSNSSKLTEDQEATSAWLAERLLLIDEALDEYKKDNVVPIVKLYGNSYTSKLLEQYPTFKDMPFNPVLVEAAEASPITVPNRAVAEFLTTSGVLKDGDVVLNLETGKKIPIGG